MNDQNKSNEVVALPESEINSPSGLTAPRICHNPNCSFQTHEPIHKCLKCGRPIWTSNQFRLISSVLIFCGLFFIILGGGLIYAVAQVDNNSSKGSEAQKLFILGIFGVMVAIGLSVLAAGLWQVVFARANRRLIYILLTLFMVGLAIVGVGRLVLVVLE